VLAVALLKQGVDVKVFERDLTAIRGEGKYRGPIQVREATDHKVACWGVVIRNVSVQLLAVPAGNRAGHLPACVNSSRSTLARYAGKHGWTPNQTLHGLP
jgi:hypothetical protein